MTRTVAPPLTAFTPAEQRLIRRLRTPQAVQRYLNRLPYNTERRGDTLRSFRQVVRRGTAHCLESALFAACVLEQHGYPPLLLTFESVDGLDHVLFLYRARGRWGTVARSRDPGLHGRKPVFRTLRALTMSYFDAYIDPTGCIEGFGTFDLSQLGRYDWRFAGRNRWKVERVLIDLPHKRIRIAWRRVEQMRLRYVAYREKHNGRKPLFYRGRNTWTEIPREYR
ncbi:MAG: hypothetical protein IT536_03765 [Hyphomicrobiales bacterium]|nr:hypothetical protein [Hyphomicrobiales bacterium]